MAHVRPRPAGRGGRQGDAVPALPPRPGVRRRRPRQQRGTGPGGRAGPRDRGRAPDRARARPVRDGRRLRAAGSSPTGCAPSSSRSLRSPAAAGGGARRPAIVAGARAGERAVPDEPPRLAATTGPGLRRGGPPPAMRAGRVGAVAPARPVPERARARPSRTARRPRCCATPSTIPGRSARWLAARAVRRPGAGRRAYQALLDADTHADALAVAPRPRWPTCWRGCWSRSRRPSRSTPCAGCSRRWPAAEIAHAAFGRRNRRRPHPGPVRSGRS